MVNYKQKFQEAWFTGLMESMDSQLDEPTRIKLMEANGRACARRGPLKSLTAAAQGDVNKLIASLGQHLGEENCKREGDAIQLRYTKCLCPIVAAGPPLLSKTWCNCSRGGVLEIFSAVAGKPARVELTHSIKRGDAFCQFLIRV